jgi:hypothetical protein
MPTQKDFKRLVRARMQKTGEAYTTARAHLLKQRPATPAQRQPTPNPAPADSAQYARLAGMSNETNQARTGCAWDKWVFALDHYEAAELPHREIARLVHEKYKIPGWWAQTVTVGYERIKGLRAIGQRRDGAYEAGRTKTIGAPVRTLYRAFRDARVRRRWLPEPITLRTAHPGKSVRFRWDDGTIVQAYFTPKGKAKTAVTIQHMKLKDRAAVDRAKAFWAGKLGELAGKLTG